MSMTTLKPVAGVLMGISLLIGGAERLPALAQPTPEEVNLNADTFPQLHKQIRPQPGESRWLELPWLIDLHAARQKAAAEGKPPSSCREAGPPVSGLAEAPAAAWAVRPVSGPTKPSS